MPEDALYANDLILFVQVVDAGSFTLAAEHTGVPKATLSRRLAALENEFGERLLQRSTRRLVLTEFGEQMLHYARHLADGAADAVAYAQQRRVAPQGTLRVTLPPDYEELALTDVLVRFTDRYPDVKLELDLSARRVDLVAERFDVAVRAASTLPDDNALVARRVAVLHNGLYASPDYLCRHEAPQTPEQLHEHTGLTLLGSTGEHQDWELSRGNERWQGLPKHTLGANSVGLLRTLALRGLGIVGMSARHAQRVGGDQKALVPVLPGWTLPPTTIWCVTAGRRLLPKRTEAFIETLKDVIGERSVAE